MRTWLIDVGLHVAARIVPLLLAALIGATVDAGLLDGRVGEQAVDALRASSFRSSAEPVALLLHPLPLA